MDASTRKLLQICHRNDEGKTEVILVTGASGFVGSALTSRLVSQNHGVKVIAAIRRADSKLPSGVITALVGELEHDTDWSTYLPGVKAVIHCEARVHVMKDNAPDPLEAYRQVNVRGTLNLARQAVCAGVSRFVFVSSIKVNGESTAQGQSFKADATPAPLDAYGYSKMEAEAGLRELSAQTGMELVIVRPPLVYGPGVKANFASMMRWIDHDLPLPLPLGRIHNARSMVALDNLVDLLITCLDHPAAIGQIFLVSDGQDVSTTDLLRRTAKAMGKTAMLFPVPVKWLEWVATLLGKRAEVQRLCGSLQVDIEKTRRLLGWQPPLSLDQGLKKAAEAMKR